MNGRNIGRALADVRQSAVLELFEIFLREEVVEGVDTRCGIPWLARRENSSGILSLDLLVPAFAGTKRLIVLIRSSQNMCQ